MDNFARPGANIAVVANTASANSESKNLALLLEAVPGAKRVAYIGEGVAGRFNPALQSYASAAANAAPILGLTLIPIVVDAPADESRFRTAIATASAQRADMIQFQTAASVSSNSTLLAKLTLEARLPAISPYPAFAQSGGLLSYGSNSADNYRKAAGYILLILARTKPGDLPVLQPTAFDLMINLRTARTIGVVIPPSMLIQATDVIE